MQKTPLCFTKRQGNAVSPTASENGQVNAIPTERLEELMLDWIDHCKYQGLSKNTIEIRRFLLEKLTWFLTSEGLAACGRREIQKFMTYARTGHTVSGGRWGNPHMTREIKPRTAHTYDGHLRNFFTYLIEQELLDDSPMRTLDPPKISRTKVQPFTPEQINALLVAARKSRHPKRDESIILFLLDTGVRASEMCGIRMKDFDLNSRKCVVLGKGNKERTIHFSRPTAKAIWKYLSEDGRENDQPVFMSDRGDSAGEPLTRSGLLQLIERLGKAACIQVTRASPHTFRHTFAVEFLRGGGNSFSLQDMLGHTSLHMTNRYVALAQADIKNQHDQFSPVERLKGRNK